MSSDEAVVELVQNAIGYGIMMALEGRDDLLRKLRALPPGSSLADAIRGHAEGFITTRSDLVNAVVDGGTQ